MIDEPTRRLGEGALRALVPSVLTGLVRRGEDFDAAEDAPQDALLEALRVWPEHPPREPQAWLATVATTPCSCSSAAAIPTSRPRPRWR
jgi:predicted RNA polymerase sigma factor